MKHSEIRDHIIHTASDLFYKNGYNLTGINQIIAEAGIAKATLYNHFSGKEDICVAYLQTKNATFLQDLAVFVKGKPEGKARIQAVVEFLVPFFYDEDFHGCWCVRTVAEVPIANEKIWAEIQLQKNKLLTYIKQLVKENLAGKSEAEVDKLAQFVYMIYEGAVSESYLHQNIWPIENGMEMLGLLLAKE
ncbi:MAG: TetR/AcrR family transcriptional regulator [Bacteroidota bacterium]